MTKLTDKPLFASGFGVQLLAHFCAIGNRQLKVVNGNERGGDLKEMSSFNPSLLKLNEVYLDNRTGDFY